jgi:hypothetical protein
MSTISTTNGQSKLLGWVLGAIFAPIALAFTGTITNLAITSAGRISALEATLFDIRRDLDAMDRKLDRLLEREGR